MIEDLDDLLGENCTLAGEFSCRLTNAERNEWFAYVQGCEPYMNFCLRHADRERAVRQGSREEVALAAGRHLEAVAAMHRVASEWYERLKARRAAARDGAKTGGAA